MVTLQDSASHRIWRVLAVSMPVNHSVVAAARQSAAIPLQASMRRSAEPPPRFMASLRVQSWRSQIRLNLLLAADDVRGRTHLLRITFRLLTSAATPQRSKARNLVPRILMLNPQVKAVLKPPRSKR